MVLRQEDMSTEVSHVLHFFEVQQRQMMQQSAYGSTSLVSEERKRAPDMVEHAVFEGDSEDPQHWLWYYEYASDNNG